MTYETEYRWGPAQTPQIIQQLILITCVATILSALIDSPISSIFGIPGPQDLFSLSWYGFQNWFIWEPITYLFVQYTGAQGITFFFIIALLFNMYMIWVLGSSVIERTGPYSFIYFYLLCGAIAGVVALFFMSMTGHYAVLSGPTAPILALLMVWAMFYPENELLFFFLFNIKAKWLIAGIVGAIVLVCLSQGDIVNLMFYFTALGSGYIYGVLAWELQGPFAITHRFDRMLAALGASCRVLKAKVAEKIEKKATAPKIVDMNTGKPLTNDDQFIDAMLAKISKEGEKSLTWTERQRMRQISEKKRKS